MRTKLSLLLVILLTASSCAHPTSFAELTDPTEIHAGIAWLEDNRSGEAQIRALLGHGTPSVRARAALALGRLERGESRGALVERLQDPEWTVRRMASFALGQLGDSSAESALLGRLAEEAHPSVRLALWRALGRLGREATVGIAGRVDGMDLPLALVAAGLSLRRLQRQAASVPVFSQALLSNDPEVRAAALYAFHRASTSGVPPAVRMHASRAIQSEQGAECEAATRVLSAGVEGVLEVVLTSLQSASLPVHQRVLLVRGVGNTEGLEATQALVSLLVMNATRMEWMSVGFHVLLETARGLEGRTLALEHRETLQRVRAQVDARADDSPAVQRRKQQFRCALSMTRDGAECPPHIRIRREGQLGGDVAIIREHLRSSEPRTRVAALQALVGTMTDASEDLRQALQDTDGSVVGTAARLLADRGQADAETLEGLRSAWGRLFASGDLEACGDVLSALLALPGVGMAPVYQEALDSGNLMLARLGLRGLSAVMAVAPVAPRSPEPSFRWEEIRQYIEEAHEVRVKVETDVGFITLRLESRWAPRTVENFLRLAETGFFDGLPFHRVIPAFVMQGGDPRGDGWGGPGYSIRCENNPLPYRSGTVGMALAGKDTGGSQWFVTHTAQPHLYGAYTVFAQVERGLDVVDRIVPGDRVLRIRRL